MRIDCMNSNRLSQLISRFNFADYNFVCVTLHAPDTLSTLLSDENDFAVGSNRKVHWSI